MRLGTYVACAVKELEERNLYPGKTNIQKLIYFALPEEQRKRLYQPYHYGPYCGDVQHATIALIKNKLILQENGGFRVARDFSAGENEDPVLDRMRVAADFFAANGFNSTDSIAQLAKVHLLSRSEREDAQKDLIGHIQKQARFLRWKELAKAGADEIQRYIHAAEKLNSQLESAAKTV